MAGLSKLLNTLKDEGRTAFIPYFTAGDPSMEWTEKFLKTLASAGADIVELGVPFSDPIADGPTNQRAAERSLRAGTTLADILHFIGRFRREGNTTPLVLFSYFNPILQMGLEAFARRAREVGANGVLTVDLPPEEASEYVPVMKAHGLDTIFLASPTTPPERLRLVDKASSGFVYYVSRMGVTGARASLSGTLREELARVRKMVKKPVAVGFGISTPEQAREVASQSDGVVVGSALVSFIEKHPPEEAREKMRELASQLVAAIRE